MARDLYQKIGERVARLRREAGLSQERLAEAAGVTPSYVAYIEAGTKKPTLTVLDQIAASLDAPLWRLFADANEAGEEKRRGAVDELVHLVRLLGRKDAAMLVPVVKRLVPKRSGWRAKRR